jgi:hypothetical protein
MISRVFREYRINQSQCICQDSIPECLNVPAKKDLC